MTTLTATEIVTSSTCAQLAARYGVRFLQALCNTLASALAAAQSEMDWAQVEEDVVVQAWNRGDYVVVLSRDYDLPVADALRAANRRLERAYRGEETALHRRGRRAAGQAAAAAPGARSCRGRRPHAAGRLTRHPTHARTRR